MYSTLFVVLLGMGTVFAGLILIIILCKLMSIFVGATEKSAPAQASAPTSNTVAPIPDKQPLLAAVSAAIAEDLGTDITKVRIHSIKRI